MKTNQWLKKYRNVFRCVTILCLFLIPNYSVWSQETADLSEDMKQQIKGYMDAANIPGLSLAIVNGESISTYSFGRINLENDQLVEAGTIFEIGSCSKAFTALAILKLEKEGKLEITDPVSRFLPWFKLKYDGLVVDISIQQLLNHTSGIPFKTISDLKPITTLDALEQTVRALLQTELESGPGTFYEYATVNYDVLGLVIEKL